MRPEIERQLWALVTVAVFFILLGITMLPRDYIMLH